MERISKTLLLCFLLLLSGRVLSQGTTLVIFSEGGQKFTLEVNGAIQNETPEARVETNNLFDSAIKVKLYPADDQMPLISKSIFNTPNGMLYYVYRQDAKGRYILEKTTHDWSGEETRLQFAKYAYPFVYDPSDYDVVRETLDPGSQDLLNDYIRQIEKQ